MRTLKLQSPQMTGVDVSAWQHFLAAQVLLAGEVDGVYDKETNDATKAYQSKKGLAPDGTVGPQTFSRAVLDGFQPAPGHVALPGMDTNVDCRPFAAGIVAAGMKFVARYYSSRTSAKLLTKGEAGALSAAGLKLAVVFEDSDDPSTLTEASGAKHAARALALADGIGQPAGSAIYFAVDSDPAVDAVRGAISDYFRAIAQALTAGSKRYAVGVYGSGLTCRVLRDSGLAAFTWLTGSTGFRESSTFRAQADLLQIAPQRKICDNRLAIDDDVAQSDNFGAFTVS